MMPLGLYLPNLIKIVLLGSQLFANKKALTPPSDGPNNDEKKQFRSKDSSEAAPHFLLYGGNALKVSPRQIPD